MAAACCSADCSAEPVAAACGAIAFLVFQLISRRARLGAVRPEHQPALAGTTMAAMATSAGATARRR
jgi:hypothetical protein